MAKTPQEMVAEARSVVPGISVDEAAALRGDPGVVFVDVREPGEVMQGKVRGAVAIPRGLLEFQADPNAAARPGGLEPGKTVILYCAAGGRAALAGKTLKDLGYEDVRNMGGFKDWADKGLPIE